MVSNTSSSPSAAATIPASWSRSSCQRLLKMRKVVLGLGISLDGYIARLNGDVDFLFMPKDYSTAPFFATVDTAILGRKTLDDALKMGGSFGGSSMKTYVLSRSKPPGERDGVVFTNKSPAALVSQLRRSRGKDIWLMGG